MAARRTRQSLSRPDTCPASVQSDRNSPAQIQEDQSSDDRTCTPRVTGEVSIPLAETVRMLPWPSRPPRRQSVNGTFRAAPKACCGSCSERPGARAGSDSRQAGAASAAVFRSSSRPADRPNSRLPNGVPPGSRLGPIDGMATCKDCGQESLTWRDRRRMVLILNELAVWPLYCLCNGKLRIVVPKQLFPCHTPPPSCPHRTSRTRLHIVRKALA